MIWYYAKGNRPEGPLTEADIQRLASEGALKPADLVWQPDYGNQWREARTVPGLFPEAAPGTAREATGGATPNRELMARARQALKGHWGSAVGASVLVPLLLWGVGLLSAVVVCIGPIVALLVTGPIALGASMFFLSMSRGEGPSVGRLFGGFRRFGAALGAILLVGIFTLLWTLLAMLLPVILWAALAALGAVVLPVGATTPADLAALGPIALAALVATYLYQIAASIAIQFRYALVFFALADDDTMGPLDAVRTSVALMKGRKWKLFALYCRFIGWALLATLTCGIGWLWLWPYIRTSLAAFYDDAQMPLSPATSRFRLPATAT